MKKIVQSVFILFLFTSCFTQKEKESNEEPKKKVLSIKKDKDQDGIANTEDQCPEIAGPIENNGCPWPDTDGDGVLDKDDACPSVAGPIENNGCPWPDTDSDGILDKDDACPTIPGSSEYNGCPKPKASVAYEVSASPSSTKSYSTKSKISGEVSSSSSRHAPSPGGRVDNLPKSGQLTAGEVNDFSKWNYWQDIAVETLKSYKESWKYFPDRRVSVQFVNEDRKPIIGKVVKLVDEKNEVIWESVSNNLGNAELWIAPRIDSQLNSKSFFLIDENGKVLESNAKVFSNGVNIITLKEKCLAKRNLEIAFMVDATGSMSDEISYLKAELLDVLKKVENKLSQTTKVSYASVFYRDKGDEYVTKKFDFTNSAENLINFIKAQQADGGGDYPEAVVEALDVSVGELKWTNENSTKLLFLILDAPPHQSKENIDKLYARIKEASKKGIIIIPLAASDANKETEYILRSFALLTNGTYTFLTNHSGIGNNHIEPTTDNYEVEKLNDLLFRIILQRSLVLACNNDIKNEYINKKLESEITEANKATIKIYPNPTKGDLNIESNKNIEELYLYDLSGKILMKKENLIKGKHKIDLTLYPQSMYLMRCKTGKDWETFKIIKN